MIANQPLFIHPVPVLKDNYVWALIDTAQKKAVIVDPGEASPVIDFLREQKLALMGILITHHHWDHTNGAFEIAQEFNAPIYGPKADPIPKLTHPLSTEGVVTIPGFMFNLQWIHVPGHTLGHAAFYVEHNLFCGDTLFAAGCGRIFEGTAKQMFASLQKIAALPAATRIYCGHEYTLNNLHFAKIVEPHNLAIAKRLQQVAKWREQGRCSLPASLEEEKETNPFLRCHHPAVKESVEKHAKQSLADVVDVFAALRKWKDTYV